MPYAPFVRHEIKIPPNVSAKKENFKLIIRGPKGEISREFIHERISLNVEDGKVVIYCALPKRNEYALAGTWKAHVENMIKGVTEGFEYRLKIVYAHFPMKVRVQGDQVIIENFLGERNPRFAKIVGNTKVEVKGNEVIVTGINIEHCGQTAANIERATKIKGRDPRVFQDGIYIVKKGWD